MLVSALQRTSIMLTLRKVLPATPLALVLLACGTAAPERLPITPPAQRVAGELPASRDALAALSTQSRATYTYDRFSLSWTGWAVLTQVSVEEGVVVARNTDTYSDYHASAIDASQSYREEGADIGSHDAGHPAKTLLELYDECEQTVLTQDPAKNDITLMFFENGVLATCTYYPHGCADDCIYGVEIRSVQFSSAP
jgi:hypothetical protein